jgi:hypothetical protein
LTRQLAIGLRDLSLGDNFKGFEETITISATSEAKIRNQLNFIPTKFIITDIDGNAVISRGSTAWDENYVYLYNNGASSVTITVQFLK